MFLRVFSSILAMLAVALGGGCGSGYCGGHERDDNDRAPLVRKLYLLDAQVPGDPWTVLLGVDFQAKAGDLGNGNADFYLNDNATPTTQKLVDVFLQSGVAQNETEGSLWMALRFVSNVKDGTDVWLGLQLRDNAGRRSNCYTLKLDFAVTHLADGSSVLSPREERTTCRAGLRRNRHG